RHFRRLRSCRVARRTQLRRSDNMCERTMRRVKEAPVPLAFLALLAIGVAGCSSGDSSSITSPTSIATSVALVTETFTGSLGQNEARIHPFTVTNAGYTLLAGFTSISPASVTALGLGIGSWDASTSTCSLNVSQND